MLGEYLFNLAKSFFLICSLPNMWIPSVFQTVGVEDYHIIMAHSLKRCTVSETCVKKIKMF